MNVITKRVLIKYLFFVKLICLVLAIPSGSEVYSNFFMKVKVWVFHSLISNKRHMSIKNSLIVIKMFL